MEIVDSFVPKFGKLLAHAATFPAVIAVSVRHNPNFGDLSDTAIEYRWVVGIDEEEVPVSASLKSVDGDGWQQSRDLAWNERGEAP
ncbi:hypothetical protein [Cryobacterium sp. 10C3]|uniref:hypothetical protein n=1 Tax=Cryobacterium sp. 10C3 TaxID=3048577 RepID=UPI002AB431FA|nr:hypothetical protein [Cryobacterium sp. 10C3]MDY7556132.1 hypothetical protein [Cryobacterium sp. 10C3]